MALGWAKRRQIFIISILILITTLIVLYFVYLVVPSATCFDGKRNQKEDGVDCGGPCDPCLANLSEPVVLWTRLFELADGFYEVAALIENTHNFAASDRFFYRMKIYNEENIVIGVREGESFINPNERFLILDPTFETKERTPVRALVEIDPVEWKYVDYSPPNVVVVSRDFSLEPQRSLKVVLKNNDIFVLEDLQVSVILSDETGRVIGASISHVDEIENGAEKIVSFSWPKTAINEVPRSIEVLIRSRALFR